MDYLSYDLYAFKTELKDIYNNSLSNSRNTGNMANSLNHLESIIESGFDGVQSSLYEVSQQLDDMLDIIIDFRNTQFIQNEERNHFLASIDSTLKAPNKTAANEKYEISLELASKNKYEAAIKFLKEAIELNPLHYRSYIQITLNLLKINNYEEAIHYAKESINFAPDNNELIAYSHSLAAQAYEKAKDFKAALHYINLAINYSDQSDYTYIRARYLAFLKDAQAIPVLKLAIENDHKFFAISLMDSAFHPLHKEREALLTSMKAEIEAKLKHGISQMETIKFHQYSISRLLDCDLQYNGFDNSIIDYRYKYLHPNFKEYKFIYISGVEAGSVGYCYNNLLEEFNSHYAKLYDFYHNQLSLIKQLKGSNTFVDYHKSYNQFLYFKMEFNQLVKSISRFVHQFKEKSTAAERIFKDNLELTRENFDKMKKRLKEEKGKKVFNLLGVVGAFILPDKLKHDHNVENCLEKLNKRVKKVTEEAQKNVENVGKHSLAIQRFADEVLINKPLPCTLD